MLLRTRVVFFSSILGVLLFPALTLAQSVPATFSITVSPEYPQPGDTITIQPRSDSIDLTAATMVVSANGKEVYQGNASSAAVTLASSGQTTIKVTLSVDGTDYVQTATIQPQSVALVVEPLASAPPLYAGKPLIPQTGVVRAVAVASFVNSKGTPYDPSKLVYTWTVNGRSIAALSGIGKMSITADTPLEYRSGSISVVVKTQDGSLSGGGSATLSSQKPTVRVYANDALLGILFDNALSGTQKMNGSELSLYSAPYSFSTVDGAPTINWFLNAAAAQAGNSLTLRPTGNGQGTASVSCTVRKGDFAVASQSLSVEFGAKSSSNFFGL